MASKNSSGGGKKSVRRAVKKQVKKLSTGQKVILVIALIVVLAVCVALAYHFGWFSLQENDTPTPISDGTMSFTFLETGNKYAGDSIFVQVGNIDILIDAGSKTNSIPTISKFLNEHMADDLLDYVIVTHAHEDHYAGFATSEGTDSLFDLYKVGTIIDFSMTNQKDTAAMYQNYLRKRDEAIARGANHLTAAECIQQNKAVYSLSDTATMRVLDSKYYYEKASSGENEHSVCLLFTEGDHHFLFTGDLEAAGERELVKRNNLPQVDLYKAGHHGSKTSSSAELMEVIQPKVICVTCNAGSPEYTTEAENQFPTQAFIDRVAPYTSRVYVTTLSIDYKAGTYTSMNGIITVTIAGGEVVVNCSENDTVLKDTGWFRENRTCPAAWK